ncbi:MAG: hypothetical protein ACNA8W_08460 [Bradymonadaceae bacterium]
MPPLAGAGSTRPRIDAHGHIDPIIEFPDGESWTSAPTLSSSGELVAVSRAALYVIREINEL